VERRAHRHCEVPQDEVDITGYYSGLVPFIKVNTDVKGVEVMLLNIIMNFSFNL
jgi:hypothetical protein